MCEGTRENGTTIDPSDPLWPDLTRAANAARSRPGPGSSNPTSTATSPPPQPSPTPSNAGSPSSGPKAARRRSGRIWGADEGRGGRRFREGTPSRTHPVFPCGSCWCKGASSGTDSIPSYLTARDAKQSHFWQFRGGSIVTHLKPLPRQVAVHRARFQLVHGLERESLHADYFSTGRYQANRQT